MKCFIGIDLGSTTTKAVILDPDRRILGRGITNSRSNYHLAAQVAQTEATHSARFTLLRRTLKTVLDEELIDNALQELSGAYRLESYLLQLHLLRDYCTKEAEATTYEKAGFPVPEAVAEIFREIEESAVAGYQKASRHGSDFFRDMANTAFIASANHFSRKARGAFDLLVGIFDKSIVKVENQVVASGFQQVVGAALERMRRNGFATHIPPGPVEEVMAVKFNEAGMVGTGYGRQRLPFPKEAIRSEILCHGLGAHALFPKTATVLDIGGQDTKAIQVDGQGVVTSFQMNDRCAAGCGRYLGYIADEMNLGLHELGPMAMTAKRTPRINSTCTVFAGAELRSRLLAGEKREDILSGLHRAIIIRAMSLLARSGGVSNEFTFTGGVAKNTAAVKALRILVEENYGSEITINIHPDSIYTGALGAALFAARDGGRRSATREDGP